MRLNLRCPRKSVNSQDVLTHKQGQSESSSCSTQNFLKDKIICSSSPFRRMPMNNSISYVNILTSIVYDKHK